jgi:hypothetical protein
VHGCTSSEFCLAVHYFQQGEGGPAPRGNNAGQLELIAYVLCFWFYVVARESGANFAADLVGAIWKLIGVDDNLHFA